MKKIKINKKNLIILLTFATLLSTFGLPLTTNNSSVDLHARDITPRSSQIIPRTVRVAIYNEPNVTNPGYTFGNVLANNYTAIKTVLENAGHQVTELTHADISDHKLLTAYFDVFLMADNVPRENITNFVKEFWLGGGSVLSFDSALAYLCYAGIMVPESEGDDGRGTYWDYVPLTVNNITSRHPISQAYNVNDSFTVPSIYSWATLDWVALQGSSVSSYFYKIATRTGNSDEATIVAYDATIGGGRALHIVTHYGLNLDDLLLDAIDWLCPRPKGRILFDLSHFNAIGVDTWDAPYVGWTTTTYSMLRNYLVNRSYTFDKLYPSAFGNLTTNNLAPYDLLIVNLPNTNFTASEVTSVTNWINDGGGLLALGDEYIYDGSKNLNYLLSSTGLSIIDVGPHSTLTTSFEHPTEEGCFSLTMGTGDQVTNTGNAFPLWGNSPSEICIAGEESGNGRIILTGDLLLSDDRIFSTNNLQFSINAANWLTASQAKVLILIGDHANPDPNDNIYKGPVATALNDLGLKFYLTFTCSYLNLSLANNDWDLVIVDEIYSTGSISNYASDIINYMDGGGHLIIYSYSIYNGGPLWDYLGYAYEGTYLSLPPIVYIWNTGHPIFNTPAQYGANNITTSLTPLGTDFVNVTLHSNATGIAGLSETATVESNAIILGVNGRAISNLFALTEYYDDTDDSTYPDALEIWENEISFMWAQIIAEPIVEDGIPGYNMYFVSFAIIFSIGVISVLKIRKIRKN